MNSASNPKTGRDAQPPSSLAVVLDQSEKAEDLVLEAAEELSSINTALKQEMKEQDPAPGVEAALEMSEAVKDKVHDASEKLSIVNLALKDEVNERHALEDQLAAVSEQGLVDRHAAMHDILTGLPNRALFSDRLVHGIAQAARHGWTLTVMFFDLDKFKIINDTNGHDVGDSVLRTIASRLKASTRDEDTVSRLGGDEFLYLLMEVSDEAVIASIAQKLIDAIEAPCHVRGPQLDLHLSVKVSVGIATFPKDGVTADALIKHADTTMYESKKAKLGPSIQ